MSNHELYNFFWNYNRVHEIYKRSKNERNRRAVEHYREEWRKKFENGPAPDSEEFRVFMRASDDFEQFIGMPISRSLES